MKSWSFKNAEVVKHEEQPTLVGSSLTPSPLSTHIEVSTDQTSKPRRLRQPTSKFRWTTLLTHSRPRHHMPKSHRITLPNLVVFTDIYWRFGGIGFYTPSLGRQQPNSELQIPEELREIKFLMFAQRLYSLLWYSINLAPIFSFESYYYRRQQE